MVGAGVGTKWGGNFFVRAGTAQFFFCSVCVFIGNSVKVNITVFHFFPGFSFYFFSPFRARSVWKAGPRFLRRGLLVSVAF